jgi:di/tricarboxylate transporter
MDFLRPILDMALPAWMSLGVVFVIFLILVFTALPADMVFVGGLAVLMLVGVLEPDMALAGFASQGLVTVGALYVVVAGLHETGGLNWLSRKMLGQPRNLHGALARLVFPVGALSAFLNNTPVVALFIPVVTEWTKRMKAPASRFLIPLSYSSILGGMCTLIGTSTNLVVNGLYIHRYGGKGLSVFDITWLGLPCAVAGMVYLLLFARRLLPDREGPSEVFDDPREYTLELEVDPGGDMWGKSLQEMDLLDVPGGYLAEVVRGGLVMSPVYPQDTLQAGDRLIYVGNLEAIRAMSQRKGLVLAPDSHFRVDEGAHGRRLIEAVVSHTCPLVGKTMKEGNFRQTYNAVVIAMARNGERLHGSLGDIDLRAGDTLLVEAHAGFIPRQRETGDFYVLHDLERNTPTAPHRAPVAFGILVGMVAAAAFGWLSMLESSLLAAGAMLACGCCSAASGRRRIEWNILMVIGASLGLGQALDVSGAAAAIADLLLGFA